MRKGIALIVATLASTSAFAQDFDFKGVYIGRPASPTDVQSKLGVECGAGAHGLQICNGPVTVAGRRADLNLVIGNSGNVQRMSLSFAADDFDAVENALTQKFGSPLVEESKVQNRMGAAFDNRTDVWGVAPAPTVRLTRYASSLDRASLLFWTEEDRAMLEALHRGDANDI